MVQVKKETVRNAILDAARDLFSDRGYHRTTLLDIAQRAGTGVSSLYSYFPSKLHLLYAVVEPWQKECIRRLEANVRKVEEPREKLQAILLGVWRDIPMDNIGLANSLMEALASAGNLSISQSVVSILTEGAENPDTGEIEGLMTAPTMFQAAQRIGRTIRSIHEREGPALEAKEVTSEVSFLFGGQIAGDGRKLGAWPDG